MSEQITSQTLEDIREAAIEVMCILMDEVDEARKLGDSYLVSLAERAHELSFFQLMLIQATTSPYMVDPRKVLYDVFRFVDEAALEYSKDGSIAKSIRDNVWNMMDGLRKQDGQIITESLQALTQINQKVHSELMPIIIRYREAKAKRFARE